MSTTVAFVSTAVPSGIISPAAKLDGNAADPTLFDAFESLVGAGANQAQGSTATGNNSVQEQATEPASTTSGNPGAWFAQIQPNTLIDQDEAPATAGSGVAGSITASGGSSSAQTIPAANTQGEGAPESAAREKVQQLNEKPDSVCKGVFLRNSLGAEFQKTVSAAKDDREALPQSAGSTTSDNDIGIPNSDIQSAQHTLDSHAAPQSALDVIYNYLPELAADTHQQTAPSVSAPLPGAPRSIRLNTGGAEQDGAENEQDGKKSQAGTDGTVLAQVAQLEPALSQAAPRGDAQQPASARASSSDADPKAASIDANEGAQVSGRAELLKHVQGQTDPTPRPIPDGTASPATANPTSADGAQIMSSSAEPKTTAARATSGNSSSDTISTALGKVNDASRPLTDGQTLPVHHSDVGSLAPAVDIAPRQISAPNSDAPVRVAFSAMPNSLEQSAFDALALRIATKSFDGDRNFSIRLDPPELGRVEVSLSVNSAGHAQAEIAADKPQTLDLLQRDAPVLERALKDAGLNLAGGFAFSLKGEGKSGGNWRDLQRDARGRDLHITADSTTASASLNGAAAIAARAFGIATTRLDIRV